MKARAAETDGVKKSVLPPMPAARSCVTVPTSETGLASLNGKAWLGIVSWMRARAAGKFTAPRSRKGCPKARKRPSLAVAVTVPVAPTSTSPQTRRAATASPGESLPGTTSRAFEAPAGVGSTATPRIWARRSADLPSSPATESGATEPDPRGEGPLPNGCAGLSGREKTAHMSSMGVTSARLWSLKLHPLPTAPASLPPM